MKITTFTISFILLMFYSQETFSNSTTRKMKDTATSFTLESDNKPINIRQTTKDTLNVEVTNSELINTNKDRVINVIFPIFTLLLGFFLNRGYEFFSEKRKIQKFGERWIAELSCLTEPIEEQKKSIKDFLVEHSKDKYEPTDLIIYEILNCEVFKSLDKANLIQFLEQKNRTYSESVQLSNKVHVFISSLNFVSTNLKKRFEEYIENSSKHFTVFNNQLVQLMQDFGQLGIKIEQKTGNDPINFKFYKNILDLIDTYIGPHRIDGEIEIFSFQKEFITPITYILSENRLNEDLKEMTTTLLYCNLEIKSIQMEKNYLKEEFLKNIEFFEKLKVKLEELISDIE